MNLFRSGKFRLSSGADSGFRIECDVLSDADWDALAHLALERLPPFFYAVGVPTGGRRFADAIARARLRIGGVPERGAPVLLVAHVLTTGRSIESARSAHSKADVIGCVAFARGSVPDWVVPLFTLSPALDRAPPPPPPGEKPVS